MKRIPHSIPARLEKKSLPFSGGAAMTANRRRIRQLFSRQLQPLEVDFLMAVIKFGTVRTADCSKVASALLRRGWVEGDRNFVRLSKETQLLLAEAVE
jgi:hypothetical protein